MSWKVGLYVTAVLVPLAAFAVEAIFIRQLKRLNAYIATGAIGFSCVLSLIGFLAYAFESGGFHRPEHHETATAANGEDSRALPPRRKAARMRQPTATPAKRPTKRSSGQLILTGLSSERPSSRRVPARAAWSFR